MDGEQEAVRRKKNEDCCIFVAGGRQQLRTSLQPAYKSQQQHHPEKGCRHQPQVQWIGSPVAVAGWNGIGAGLPVISVCLFDAEIIGKLFPLPFQASSPSPRTV